MSGRSVSRFSPAQIASRSRRPDQLRSGKEFSPFATFSAAPGAAFNFEGLLQCAYARQDDALAGIGGDGALDPDDAVDNAVDFPAGRTTCPLNPAASSDTHSATNAATPLSNALPDMAPDALEGATHDAPGSCGALAPRPPNAQTNAPERAMPSASESPSTLQGAPAGATPCGSTSAPTKGAAASARRLYRKKKDQGRKTAKKTLLRGSSSQGALLCNPTAVARNLKDLLTHQTGFKAASMPHTGPGYQGRATKGAVKRVYGLEELVGEGSKFGFDLRQWDGM